MEIDHDADGTTDETRDLDVPLQTMRQQQRLSPLNLATWKLENESMVDDPLNVTPENSLTSIYRYNTAGKCFRLG